VSKLTPKNITHLKTELTQLKDGFATSLTTSKRNRTESEKPNLKILLQNVR